MKIGWVALVGVLMLASCGGVASTLPSSTIKTSSVITSNEMTIEADQYSYTRGDIVRVGGLATIQLGSIVIYDNHLNNTDARMFGPRTLLVKVIGLPGDSVVFDSSSYQANSIRIALGRQSDGFNVLWGGVKYATTAGLTLKVANGEYLADRWLGWEVLPEDYGKTDAPASNCFTVRSEAVLGVIVEQVGHTQLPTIIY
jgi:hypothetical protein